MFETTCDTCKQDFWQAEKETTCPQCVEDKAAKKLDELASKKKKK